MRRWSGIIAREGVQTGDGRVMVDGSLYWENLPLPFEWSPDTNGHMDVVVVGTVDAIERQTGGVIFATGMIDDEGDEGIEAIRQIAAGLLRGVSIVPDDWDMQVIDTTVDPDALNELDELVEAIYGSAGDPDPGADSGLIVYEDAAGDIIERYLRLRIRALTLVDVPAFIDAEITLDDMADTVAVASVASGADTRCLPCEVEAMTAAAGPVPTAPPAEWMTDPQFAVGDGRLVEDPYAPGRYACPQTITADGRVFGHFAPWHVCHTGGSAGECVLAPRSPSGYARFQTGELVCADGSVVNVGQLTIGGGHADLRLSFRGATEHYDNVGSVWADVVCGEDRFGAWFSGALRPGLTDVDMRAIRAASVSGDWRPVGGVRDLAAIHSVVSPGFPVARSRNGRPGALVAAGARVMERLTQARAGSHVIAGLAARLDRLEAPLLAEALAELRTVAADRARADLRAVAGMRAREELRRTR